MTLRPLPSAARIPALPGKRSFTLACVGAVFLLAWVALSCGGSSSGGSPDPVAPGQVERGPQVALPGPTSMTVAWTTDVPALGSVEYGPMGRQRVRIDGPALTAEHVFVLEGLLPATEYRYRILVDGSQAGGDHVFHTSTADPSTPLRFAVFGDCGWGGEEQRRIGARAAAASPEFVLIPGDVVYPSGTAADITARYFVPYAGIIDRIPFFPVLGNHDYTTERGRPLLDALYLPTNGRDGTERYYSFDRGAVHFAALDSNSDLRRGSPQYAWLDGDLARSEATWKIVYFHHPPYSSSKHGSDLDLRGSLAPLFDARRVDLVFCGHDHNYERSYPLRAEQVIGAEEEPDYTDPGGVVYVVTGGGGADLYESGKSYFTAFSKSAYHFVQVDIDGSRLQLKAIGINGSTLDAMTITKAP